MSLAIKTSETTDTEVSTKDHVVFLSAIFCFWFSTYIYIPTFGVYLETIGLSYSAIGIILGSYGITQILLRFPLGLLSGRLVHLRKKLLFIGFIMATLSGLFLVFFQSFTVILIARLLAGITASMWVMATILYSQYFAASRASQAMSIMQFFTVSAQFISMVICSFLINLYGWDFPFWVGTVTALIGAILILNIKEVETFKQINKEGIVNLLKKTHSLKRLKMVTILSLLGHAVLFITIFGFSPIYAMNIGINEQSIIYLVCGFFIPHALASLLLAIYKVERKYNQIILFSSFMITTLFLFIIPLSNSFLVLIISHMAIGLMLGLIFPILLGEVVMISTPELKLSAMGFYQSFYALGILLGPLAGGEVAHFIGLNEVFYFAGVLSLIATVLVLLNSFIPMNKWRSTKNSIKIR